MATEIEINELNYEMYAIDYMEGTLSDEENRAMEAFLEQHIHLREELSAITSVVVPGDAVVFHDKESLKRKADSSGAMVMISRKWAAAAAAALVLMLFGIFWIVAIQPPYGELAADSPAFTVHYAIEHTYRVVDDASQSPREMRTTYLADSDNPDRLRYPKDTHIADRTSNLVAAVQASTVEENGVQSDLEAAGDVIEGVPFRVKMRVVDPAVVPEDQYFVLPVTIQLYELSEASSREARRELDELAALEDSRNARRKQWKEGALSLLQDTFIPNGVNRLIDN